MSPSRADLLDVIYEDDETDEGAVSADCGTSLHGHPDHEHVDEDVRALSAENALLRENVAELVREVARADAEMARWRSRCRKIEDERDALSRELDRCKAELERRHTRPQPMVVYSTTESGTRPEQQPPPVYRTSTSPDAGPSPPLRFASRSHTFTPSASQPYARPGLPSIAVSPTSDPTPPGVGVPTHRGRLAPPRTSPSPSPRDTERERKQELNRWQQAEQSQMQEQEQNRFSWGPTRVELDSFQRFEPSHREAQQSQRELERAQQEWEHVQFSREQDRHPSPVVYSTGVSDEWSYLDIPREKDGWNVAHLPYFPPVVQPASLSSLSQTPLVYSSAYPHPNGHGQGRYERDDGSPNGNPGLKDPTPPQTLKNTQSSSHAQMQQPQLNSVVPEHPEPHQTPTDDVPGTPVPSVSMSSSGSASSAGSYDAPQGDAIPRTPPDPALVPPTFAFSPTSPAFTPTGLRGFPQHVLSPTSAPFQPHMPVVDPEFGPVIVHGPLPPRHTQVPHAQAPAATPQRRKREPAVVPPRHLAGGKGSGAAGLFGGAAFGGAAMGMGGGLALAVGERGTEGDGVWAWRQT